MPLYARRVLWAYSGRLYRGWNVALPRYCGWTWDAIFALACSEKKKKKKKKKNSPCRGAHLYKGGLSNHLALGGRVCKRSLYDVVTNKRLTATAPPAERATPYASALPETPPARTHYTRYRAPPTRQPAAQNRCRHAATPRLAPATCLSMSPLISISTDVARHHSVARHRHLRGPVTHRLCAHLPTALLVGARTPLPCVLFLQHLRHHSL